MRPVLLGCLAALGVAVYAPTLSDAGSQLPASPVAAKRDSEPVVLKGSQLGDWSAPANQTVKIPFMDLAGEDACSSKVGAPDPSKIDPGSYNPTSGGIGIPDPSGPTAGAVTYDPNACPPQDYAKPDIDTAAAQNGIVAGTPTNRILGYRWTGKKFVQIPLQVDEVFTRYLENSRSGFALYSGEDQHTTYAYDREGFRYTDSDPSNPCHAIPREVDGTRLKAMKDPVPGLDSNDEVAFMYSDGGRRAPRTAALPDGIQDAKLVVLADPFSYGKRRFVYVMRAKADGPKPAFDASNGYVSYQRDANADQFAYSQSSYGDYGNTTKGPYCDPKTGRPDTSHGAVAQRRPLDTATVSTGRYRFRYDGRWLLTGIQIAPKDNGRNYGPDLVDRWKARAFAQDPSSKTPCCGYEEEDSNWGGSSITLGERVGPVRAIRETWGADSGTNVIRRETFYRDELRQKTWLRVHVIPPLDGIYSQWDFNAGRVNRFYDVNNSSTGWPIDGHNDEVFGNLDDPCNDNYDSSDTGAFTQGYRQAYKMLAYDKYSFCDPFPYHLSADLPDPTVSAANASLAWSEVSGGAGTIVDRTSASLEDLSPGGAAQSVLAVPYYRDDACFDDGTGSDPGPELHPRDPNAERATGANGARVCWRGNPAVAGGDPRYWQGSIGTHGIHILFIADSDNARLTVPTDEVVAETRMVMLPGQRDGSVGEQYGRGFEKQLAVAVAPYVATPALPGLPGKSSPQGGSTGPGSTGGGDSTGGDTTTPTTSDPGATTTDPGTTTPGSGGQTGQQPGTSAPATPSTPAKHKHKHKAKHKKHRHKKRKHRHRRARKTTG